MPIVITTISVLVITGLVWFLNKILPFKVCPICAGVSLTWLLLSIGMLVGVLQPTNYQLLTAVLMGGTVVGMAYQGERRTNVAPENVLKFRTAVIVPGFVLVYLALRNLNWLTLALEALVLAIVTWFYFIVPKGDMRPHTANEKVRELEEKMKNCC